MKVVNQNILDVTSGVIVHQVNCMGVMGSGLAAQIRDKWPIVFEKYSKYKFSLGQVQFVQVDSNLYVCNIAGQFAYGKQALRFTNYTALETGFPKIKMFSKDKNLQTYLPWKIGCGLGGGVWSIVADLIEKHLPDAIICKV